MKSITAKHLALSCQCLGAFMALHPSLTAAFTYGLLPPRQNMLLADFGRALQVSRPCFRVGLCRGSGTRGCQGHACVLRRPASPPARANPTRPGPQAVRTTKTRTRERTHSQDYRIHHEEVCSKLVAIMRERLSANIKQLPALAAGWPAGGARTEAPAPSGFATTAARQLGILSGALSPLMLPEELHSIFGRIGLMFSRTLAEAYELLEPHGEAWEQQLRADIQVGGAGPHATLALARGAGIACATRACKRPAAHFVEWWCAAVHVSVLRWSAPRQHACRPVWQARPLTPRCASTAALRISLAIASQPLAPCLPNLCSSFSTACASYPWTRPRGTPTWRGSPSSSSSDSCSDLQQQLPPPLLRRPPRRRLHGRRSPRCSCPARLLQLQRGRCLQSSLQSSLQRRRIKIWQR